MTREEIVQFMARREQAFGQHDLRALMEEFAEGCVLQSPTAGTVTGRDAIEQVHRTWFTAFPDLAYQLDDIFLDGDRAAVVGTLTGTDLGGFMGLAPTGKRFKFPVVSLCTFAGQQIVHERRLYDFTGMLVQIGTLKAKPA